MKMIKRNVMMILFGCLLVGSTVSLATDQTAKPISMRSTSISSNIQDVHSELSASDYNMRGIYRVQQQAYEQSKQDFLMAISLAKTQDERNLYTNNLAMTYKNLGQYDLALKAIDTVLANAPNLIPALDTKGDILISMRHYDEAESYLTNAILLNPNIGTSYYNRGRAYEAQGEKDKARADYQQAMTLPGDYQKKAKDKLQQINSTIK